jgi:hypothetical protein
VLSIQPRHPTNLEIGDEHMFGNQMSKFCFEALKYGTYISTWKLTANSNALLLGFRPLFLGAFWSKRILFYFCASKLKSDECIGQ